MKEFTEAEVNILYYADGNILLGSVLSGTDPHADDIYDDLEP